jgi:predicted ABC-type ATPase
MSDNPRLVIVGGPNGAGKTTLARQLTADGSLAYLGADLVAEELSLGSTGADAVAAGRAFLGRVSSAIVAGISIVLETTLSGLGTTRLIREARARGYSVSITFVFVDSARQSELRIRDRVKKGGHLVQTTDIERRFPRSVGHFWKTYRLQANHWRLLYNGGDRHVEVAVGEGDRYFVADEALFERFLALVEGR